MIDGTIMIPNSDIRNRVEYGGIICFIIDIRLEFTILSDPETLAIRRSEEGGVFAKIYWLFSSKMRHHC